MNVHLLRTGNRNRIRLHKHMTAAEAVLAIAEALGVPATEGFDQPEITMELEPGWALDVRLSVRAHRFLRDEGGEAYRILATVNGSSAQRPPAQARAFATLYGELADMACLVEAMVGDLTFLTEEDALEERKPKTGGK